MRAFILRRMALLEQGMGDALAHRVRALGEHAPAPGVLRRATDHPYAYMDVDKDASGAGALRPLPRRASDVPVVVCRGEPVLKNPSNEEVAECLGLNAGRSIRRLLRDLVVVGAGPAGLAAAVYGASEGLDVLVLETDGARRAGGDQLEDRELPGLPDRHLGPGAGRRRLRAGAEVRRERSIVDANRRSAPLRPAAVRGRASLGRIDRRARARSSSRPGPRTDASTLRDLARFEGVGVYYGATHVEAQLCLGDEVVVVGGGNSAGQAAVFLSARAHVHLLVRGDGLADDDVALPHPAHRGDPQHHASDAHRDRRRSTARDASSSALAGRPSGERGTSNCARLHDDRRRAQHRGSTAAWRSTTRASSRPGRPRTPTSSRRTWPLARPPLLLETSLPGVFAVGDVRAQSVKRVASAVGEGSICVQLVHRARLRSTGSGARRLLDGMESNITSSTKHRPTLPARLDRANDGVLASSVEMPPVALTVFESSQQPT